MDPFTVTVRELKQYLADKPEGARVLVTPPQGAAFPLLGWCLSADSNTLILTGAEGSYDTEPEST